MTLVDTIIQANGLYSRRFVDGRGFRKDFRKNHPTQIGIKMCVDERCSPEVFGTMPGLLEFWRSAGCVIDPGWHSFRTGFMDWFRLARDRKQPCLVIMLYHFSPSDPRHLGCKAHKCNELEARKVAWAQSEDFNQKFEESDGSHNLYAITVGLNTDTGSLVFERRRGSKVLDIGTIAMKEPHVMQKDIRDYVREFYRGQLPEQVAGDLGTSVAWGNFRHTMGIVQGTNPHKDHGAAIIAVGGGLNWFGVGEALVVGTFVPEFLETCKMAADIVAENFRKGRISKRRGAALLIGSPFRPSDGRPGRKMSEEETDFLASRVVPIVRKKLAGIDAPLHIVKGVINNDTRQLYVTGR